MHPDDKLMCFYFLPTSPAGIDYSDLIITSMFDATILTRIVTVHIVDDNVVEDTEFINLALTSLDNAVMLNPAATRINIEDIDSESKNKTTFKFCFSTVMTVMY